MYYSEESLGKQLILIDYTVSIVVKESKKTCFLGGTFRLLAPAVDIIFKFH